MGTGRFRVDTTNREAQAWFDYGVKLYHAFNHEEAKQAFAKAAALDPMRTLRLGRGPVAWSDAQLHDLPPRPKRRSQSPTAPPARQAGRRQGRA
jgi:hypothetical protein